MAVNEAYGSPPDAPHPGLPVEVRCASCTEFSAFAWPGDTEPARCEFCRRERPAPWRYVRGVDAQGKPTERELTEREAKAQADFYSRLERMIGDRDWRPGDESGVRCPKCRREYRWSEEMALAHDGDCFGQAPLVAEHRNPYMRLVK